MAFSTERTFGIEIEMVAPASCNEVARHLTSKGIPCSSTGYTHQVMAGWKIVTDASVYGAGNYGMELVSPVLKGEAGLAEVVKVMKLLKKLGCQVNNTCGLHVHVDGRDLGLDGFKMLAMVCAKYEGTIDKLVAPNRREGNTYCRSNRWRGLDTFLQTVKKARNIEQVAAIANEARPNDTSRSETGNRYYKLNFQSYWRQGTVEFRQHEGTLDEKATVAWIKMVVALVQGAATRDIGRWDHPGVTLRGTDTDHLFFRRYVLDNTISRYFNPIIAAGA